MSKGEYFEAQRSVIGSMLFDGEHVAGLVMHRSREEDYAPPGKDSGGMDEGEFYMIIYKCGFPMDGPESRPCEEVDEDGPLSCDSCPFGYAEEEDF